MYTCHTHASDKAVGQNEMPSGRDTCVVPSNTVLYRGPIPSQEGDIWGSEPPVCSDAARYFGPCLWISAELSACISLSFLQYAGCCWLSGRKSIWHVKGPASKITESEPSGVLPVWE